MTAGERLLFLSGRPGRTAGEQLRMIAGALATSGALLVAYSGLPTGTATQHILVDHFRDDDGQVYGAGAKGAGAAKGSVAAGSSSAAPSAAGVSGAGAGAGSAGGPMPRAMPATVGQVVALSPDLQAAAAALAAQAQDDAAALLALQARQAQAAQVVAVLAQIELMTESAVTVESHCPTDEELAMIVAAIAAATA